MTPIVRRKLLRSSTERRRGTTTEFVPV